MIMQHWCCTDKFAEWKKWSKTKILQESVGGRFPFFAGQWVGILFRLALGPANQYGEYMRTTRVSFHGFNTVFPYEKGTCTETSCIGRTESLYRHLLKTMMKTTSVVHGVYVSCMRGGTTNPCRAVVVGGLRATTSHRDTWSHCRRNWCEPWWDTQRNPVME